VHRIGRTGRAGRSGSAISFVTPRERYLLKSIERATRQPLEQMQLPSVDEVNSTRLARFDDAISQTLGDVARIDVYRDVIAHYVREHDVPEVDVAAALAVLSQGDTPLLLEPEPEPVRAPREDRFSRDRDRDRDRDDGRDRFDRDRGDRGGRHDRDDRDRGERRPRSGGANMTTYRLAVGRRHRVEPRQIVGALANEGGLSRGDFGAIQIRPDFSLVELPADMPSDVLDRLADTRLSGKLIEIRPDRGAPNRRPADGDERPPRKPRHRD
jgi:ATP-dependent RNA helicase DeaD